MISKGEKMPKLQIFKVQLSGVVAACIFMCVGSLFQPVAVSAQSNIVALLPLSGPQSEFGVAVQRGLSLALEGSEVRVVFEDHRGKPTDAASAFESLVSSNAPAALVVFGSNTSLAVASKAQERGIPMIAIATSDLIQKDKPNVFRHMLSPNTSARLLEEEVQRRGLSSVSAVTTTHDGMIAFKESFAARLKHPLVDDVLVDASETDLKPVAMSLLRKRPSGIFIGLMPPQAALFARAIRGMGYKGELFAATQIDMPSEFVSGGASFEGLWFARDGATRDPEFLERYRAKYQETPATFALNGYDVGLMIREGITSENLVNHLTKLAHFKGALGTYGANPDRAFSLPGSLWQISNGVPKQLSSSE